MPKPEFRPRICDYEGSDYRTRFWEGKGRDYEDLVERIALRRLLPASGRRLLEVGAGFGRLTNEYSGFEQVVLLDYSFSQLRYAQDHLGVSDRYLYVAADAYHLPFRPGSFDAVTVVRMVHHIADVAAFLRQIRSALIPGGTLVMEYANKRHLKAMLRYALGRQTWNPHDLIPVEFVELNFDFHPQYMRERLEEALFALQRSIPVSFFRLASIKDRVPSNLLSSLDGLLQLTGLLYTPSIFTRSAAAGATPLNLHTEALFVCPDCGAELERQSTVVTCTADRQRWAIRDGIYDFKAPLDE